MRSNLVLSDSTGISHCGFRSIPRRRQRANLALVLVLTFYGGLACGPRTGRAPHTNPTLTPVALTQDTAVTWDLATEATASTLPKEMDLLPPTIAGGKLGRGYHPTHNTLTGECVDAPAISTGRMVSDAVVGRTVYSMYEAETSARLIQLFDLDTKAAAGIGPWGGSARGKLLKQAIENKNAYHLVVHARVELPPSDLESTVLTASGRNARNRNARTFFERCGSRFVIGEERGAYLYALVSIQSNSHSEAKALSLKVKGKLTGVFSTSADLKSRLSTAVEGRSVTYEFDRLGELEKVPSPDALLRAVDGLVESARTGAVARTGWRLGSYRLTGDLPNGFQDLLDTWTDADARLMTLLQMKIEAQDRVALLDAIASDAASYDLSNYDWGHRRGQAAQRQQALVQLVSACQRERSQCALQHRTDPTPVVIPALPPLPPERVSNWQPAPFVVDVASPTPQAVATIPAGVRAALRVEGLWSMYPEPSLYCRATKRCGQVTDGWTGPKGYPWFRDYTPFSDTKVPLGRVVIQLLNMDGTIRSTQMYEAGDTVVVPASTQVLVAVGIKRGDYRAARQHPKTPLTVHLTRVDR